VSELDWSKAPEGAEFYAGGLWWKNNALGAAKWMNDSWFLTPHSQDELAVILDYQARPTEWPTEQRIDIVGTNGGGGMHYDEQREAQSAQKAKEIVATALGYQSKPDAIQNVYERVIVGKRGTGKCVVDVYRVLDAFKTDSAAIDHAIKKLLCGGLRGNKNRFQDYKEAIRSIDEALALLSDKEGEQ
jgi:hypothetical protein